MSEYITVRWAGEVRRAKVVKRFKNGKVKVQMYRGRWAGGRPGSFHDDINVTVEPWQVVDETKAEAHRLTAEWRAAFAAKESSVTDATIQREQEAYDSLVDFVEANGLNDSDLDPRGPVQD